ncbi:DDB1- and CUL4-associated factor 15-like [Ciona intestinalis]
MKFSVVQSLRSRETHGVYSRYPIPRCGKMRSRLFCSIPTRLAFSLKDIVSEHVLMEEGHVFLGFSGDGVFVMSYTESFEAFNQSASTSYSYRLHWWKFKQNQPMVKIRSTLLFINEEILNNLKLSYVEWPNIKSKVVIYGVCRHTGNCYITVSSIPSTQPCDHCDAQLCCLEHSFVAHMKFSTVSTSAPVISPVCFSIDDLMILNMGHSIGVISLGLLTHPTQGGLPLSSIKNATFEEKLSEVEEINIYKNQSINDNCSTIKPTIKRLCSYCGFKIRPVATQSDTPQIFLHPTPPNKSPGKSKLVKLSSFMEMNKDPTSSPSASESSGSIYCIGDASQCNKPTNCRKTDGIVTFFETLYTSRFRVRNLDIPGDENGLFCGPVTFQGVSKAQLHPVSWDKIKVAEAFSQHLVLDIEHVIFDVLRTRCYTTYKFGHLIDYDVQIVETSSSTRSVTLSVIALLNVAPSKGKNKFQDSQKSEFRKSQQFQFFLCWSVQTGRYEVVAATPLSAYCEKTRGKWDVSWVVGMKNSIQRACGIPLLCHRSVYVLDNSSVLQGRSLSLLWDKYHIVALRK